ncbi:hypothetical protein B0H13DRAFT_2319652 [Mycena leptocephala]|nr:hypothetical protein B0H13DRAFT_2319652 [Mycena leptocephala]
MPLRLAALTVMQSGGLAVMASVSLSYSQTAMVILRIPSHRCACLDTQIPSRCWVYGSVSALQTVYESTNWCSPPKDSDTSRIFFPLTSDCIATRAKILMFSDMHHISARGCPSFLALPP